MQFVNKIITVRPITAADSNTVVSLFKNGWVETYPNDTYGVSEAAVQEAVNHFGTTTIHRNKFVAEVKDKIVGVISVKEGLIYTIQSLYVTKVSQSTGVGTALLHFIFDKFGDHVYTLQVAVYNTRAIDFYKKFGFEVVEDSLMYVEFYNLRIPQITMRKETRT